MKMLICKCWMCKHGRKWPNASLEIKGKRHSARTKVRTLLRRGEYDDLPDTIDVGYTD